jgi:hypothetical protein
MTVRFLLGRDSINKIDFFLKAPFKVVIARSESDVIIP